MSIYGKESWITCLTMTTNNLGSWLPPQRQKEIFPTCNSSSLLSKLATTSPSLLRTIFAIQFYIFVMRRLLHLPAFGALVSLFQTPAPVFLYKHTYDTINAARPASRLALVLFFIGWTGLVGWLPPSFITAMPTFAHRDSSFWMQYGNKLRVNGTVEKFCNILQREREPASRAPSS